MGIKDIIFLIFITLCCVMFLSFLFHLLIFIFELLFPRFEVLMSRIKNYLKGGIL
jgi:hypothetical protein